MIEKIDNSEQVIVINRQFNAPANKVFDAWTKPELMCQWFAPSDEMTNPIMEIDFKIGGLYRIGFQNKQEEDNTDIEKIQKVGGQYQEIIPNEKIVFTWQWEPPHELSGIQTLVTLDFQENNGKTEFTLTHEGISIESEFESHDKGWNGCFERLSKLDWNSIK